MKFVSKYPETKPLFENAAKTSIKNSYAIAAYASNIDNLGISAVEKMSQSHVMAHAGHYPMVADALITAMGDVLGEAFTDARKNAWVEAYTFLANILMQREQELYAQR
jgi:nitric oxide dioxygenase